MPGRVTTASAAQQAVGVMMIGLISTVWYSASDPRVNASHSLETGSTRASSVAVPPSPITPNEDLSAEHDGDPVTAIVPQALVQR